MFGGHDVLVFFKPSNRPRLDIGAYTTKKKKDLDLDYMQPGQEKS